MRVVIVGAGQAGAALAARLRALGHRGAVTLIGAESHPPYQRPPLSKAYLLGQIGPERLWLRAADFWAQNDISLRLGQPVTAIDARAKTLRLGAEDLSYDMLALTTGARPRRLPAAIGGDLGGVFTLRGLDDVDALRPEFRPGARLLVVGGGYIGLEAAAVARKLGLEVTLVEMAPRILQRVAAAPTSDRIRALHQAHGVTLIEGVGLHSLTGDTRVTGATLGDGRQIAADLVLVGVGVTPAEELAAAAGLRIENGIATDAFGRTSDPAIWAAGDCASFPLAGQQMRLESVGNAIDQAELVAANMLGATQAYLPRPWFWSDQYDMKLQMAGLGAGHDRIVTRQDPAGGESHWYFNGPRLIAIDAMNDARAYMVGKRLIEAGQSPAPQAIAEATDLKTLLKG